MAATQEFTVKGLHVRIFKASFQIEGMYTVIYEHDNLRASITNLIKTIHKELKEQAIAEVKEELAQRFIANLDSILNEKDRR